MNRVLALLGALILAFISISSACTAASPAWLRFTLQPERGGNNLQLRFQHDRNGHEENNWSSSFRPSDLVGLDLAGFRGPGSRPLRFAVIREAGRIDCSGEGGDSRAAGNCSFTANPAFTALLESRGIGRPTEEQAFGLTAVNARRDVIDAVAAAHYPAPSINDLIALSALGVDAPYINGMARAGYRPRTIDTLIQFKALEITPEWIGQFVRIGYGGLPSDQLIQLKALNITPEYIAGFDRIGYRHLPVDQLVQLKALDITPEFVQRIAAVDATRPSVDKLVELKALGRRR